MLYKISSRSVTDCVSLSVKTGLHNITTLLVTVSDLDIQVILFTWQVLHLWGQKRKTNGAYDRIKHFASNFAKYSLILKILSPAN